MFINFLFSDVDFSNMEMQCFLPNRHRSIITLEIKLRTKSRLSCRLCTVEYDLVFTQVLDPTRRASKCKKVCRCMPWGTLVFVWPGKGLETSVAFCLKARSAMLSQETSILKCFLKSSTSPPAQTEDWGFKSDSLPVFRSGPVHSVILERMGLLAFWNFLATWINYLGLASVPLSFITPL